MTDTVFQNWGIILPWKSINKIEHEEIGTISKDADNADQKVKWFLKVHIIHYH